MYIINKNSVSRCKVLLKTICRMTSMLHTRENVRKKRDNETYLRIKYLHVKLHTECCNRQR